MNTDNTKLDMLATPQSLESREQCGYALHIREAHADDITAMHAIRMAVTENRLSDPSWLTPAVYRSHLGDSGTSNTWVCEEGGRIVGFSTGRLVEQDLWALFVDRAHEGRGIGRSLLAAAIQWMFAKGATCISLTTTPDTRADYFYLTSGWTRGEFTSTGEVTYRLINGDAIASMSL